MNIEEEYKAALFGIEEHFTVVKSVLQERLKNSMVHADVDTFIKFQAQYQLLEQIETETNNFKVGE